MFHTYGDTPIRPLIPGDVLVTPADGRERLIVTVTAAVIFVDGSPAPIARMPAEGHYSQAVTSTLTLT